MRTLTTVHRLVDGFEGVPGSRTPAQFAFVIDKLTSVCQINKGVCDAADRAAEIAKLLESDSPG